MKFYNLGHKTFETDFNYIRCHESISLWQLKFQRVQMADFCDVCVAEKL